MLDILIQFHGANYGSNLLVVCAYLYIIISFLFCLDGILYAVFNRTRLMFKHAS